MSNCRICNHETKNIISLGKMPIANGFISDAKTDEFFFELGVALCPKCYMVQLTETVPPEMMFNENYQFVSSTSKAMEKHFETNADEIKERLKDQDDPFVVELGCNDGIMLKHIAAAGIRHLGVEPSVNVAQMARKNGVTVTGEFFNEQTAADIVKEHGQADVICGSNVFCHIEDMNSVFEGISALLKDEGILFFEDPYLLDIVQKASFDQIYDEHVYYFCGLSINELAKRHGMRLVGMKEMEVHGGSMRYYLQKGIHEIRISVDNILQKEKDMKLDEIEGYKVFKKRVDQICRDLKGMLDGIKKRGGRIVGYGATSKSTTLFNYANIGPDLVEYICDNTPNKIGKLTPGMHIPIRSHEEFLKDDMMYTLLLAWNHKKEIFEKEKEYRDRGGKFITCFPEVVIE